MIINFCPTGMVPTKEMTPHVPVSASEIVEEVHQAHEKGITIVHIHARDESGVPTYYKQIYSDIFSGIRKYCPGLVICGSTSGRLNPEFEKRSEVIELQPDMCSLTLSSLNFSKAASVNEPQTIKKLAEKMEEFGVHPELECFDLGMINYGKYLIEKGYVKPPFYWNLLFGNVAGFQANLLQMGTAVQGIEGDHYVALTGIGDHQFPVQATAVAMGYGVRVGLEDNIWADLRRTKLATNSFMLNRIHRLLDIHERDYMQPESFGELGFYNKKGVAERFRNHDKRSWYQ